MLNPADREERAEFDCGGEVLFAVGGIVKNGKVPARSACIIKR